MNWRETFNGDDFQYLEREVDEERRVRRQLAEALRIVQPELGGALFIADALAASDAIDEALRKESGR